MTKQTDEYRSTKTIYDNQLRNDLLKLERKADELEKKLKNCDYSQFNELRNQLNAIDIKINARKELINGGWTRSPKTFGQIINKDKTKRYNI